MKSKFKFDSTTGTMVTDKTEPTPSVNIQDSAIVESPTANTAKPTFAKEKTLNNDNESKPMMHQERVVQMKRSSAPTPLQLVNDKGPESYLEPITGGVLLFRERQDYDICQIVDDKSRRVLGYIGGYALKFCFNMEELNTLERIEQFLEGVVKLFRHEIMNQTLGGNINSNP